MEIRLAASLQSDSIVDGDGIRTVIWTQGCPHHCPGCHNAGTWSFKGGYLETIDKLKEDINHLEGQDGITFSGGEPINQVSACLELAKYCKEKGYNIWCYSGYTYEELLHKAKKEPDILSFLEEIDVLVDGKFLLEQKSYDLTFRGSKNQRVIDVNQSLKENQLCLLEKDTQKQTYKREDGIYI